MAKKVKSDVLVKKIIDWLNTEEGKKEIQDAIQRANEVSAKFRKAYQVDWRSLHTPYGPADGSGIWPHQRI